MNMLLNYDDIDLYVSNVSEKLKLLFEHKIMNKEEYEDALLDLRDLEESLQDLANSPADEVQGVYDYMNRVMN